MRARWPIARLVALVPIALVCLPTTSCRPEIAVEITTRVFSDGGAERAVEIRGRTAEGEDPDARDWLASEAKVAIAEPDRWSRIDESPGWARAEGYFASAADLPAVIAHLERPSPVPDRVRVELRRDDLVVATRRVWRESWGDPFGAADADAAIDGLIALARRALHTELAKDLGSDTDLSGVDAWLDGEVRGLARELLADRRSRPGATTPAARRVAFGATLSRHGVAIADPAEPGFWERNAGPLLAWTRDRLAAAASTPGRVVDPSDLVFPPASPDGLEADFDAAATRSFGSPDALWEEAQPLIDALEGYYASVAAGRLRFEARLELPGRLLRTNGTPDGGAALWLFRGDDLALGEVVMEAESVELEDEPLRAVGARRTYETADLVRLVDLLTARDPRGELAEALRRAVGAGSLDALEDPDALPDDLEPAARELAELLRGGPRKAR